VVERVKPIGIKENAGFRVTDKGIVGPAIPKPGDDIEILAGAAIPFAMLHMFFQTKVQRGVGI
jgi:hypothetical protein